VATMRGTSMTSELFEEPYKKRALCEKRPINLGLFVERDL